MEGGRLTFSLLCSGPPATPRKTESEGEEDIKEGRKSGAGEEGGNIDEGNEKGKKEWREEVDTIKGG